MPRARHDGHAGGQEVVAYHFEGGFTAAEQGREEGLDFAVDSAAALATEQPISVEPVNASFLKPGWSRIY